MFCVHCGSPLNPENRTASIKVMVHEGQEVRSEVNPVAQIENDSAGNNNEAWNCDPASQVVLVMQTTKREQKKPACHTLRRESCASTRQAFT